MKEMNSVAPWRVSGEGPSETEVKEAPLGSASERRFGWQCGSIVEKGHTRHREQ